MLRGRPVQYEIARSPRRKRLALEVGGNQRVVARAPVLTDDETIERFIRRNANWLLDRLEPERARQERTRRVKTPHGPIEYELTRNPRRKRMTVFVHPHGAVEVRAPTKAPTSETDSFVCSKADWIRQKLREAEEAASAAGKYVSGESILFRGQPHTLLVEVSPTGEGQVEARDGKLVVRNGSAADEGARRDLVRKALREWMVQRALEVVRERISVFAERLGVQPRRVRIKDMKSRWGSCSAKGNISISFRIVMAPPEVVDYLLAHELCHIIHRNHSKDFWALVGHTIPRYEELKKWLREHESELEL